MTTFFAYSPRLSKWLPYFWISLGAKQYGMIPDDGHQPLFSERYGHTKVRRFLGYKFIAQDRTANSLRLLIGWRVLHLHWAVKQHSSKDSPK